jgi:3-isopropylmalate/(R)-2-methylmalate dehydratase large subunit
MQKAPPIIKLDNPHRLLFLTKDLKLIKGQLYDGLKLSMADLSPDELLDDINTDIMTPAWVCFHHDPKSIAYRAYAGLMYQGQRVFSDGALMRANFQAIVSGQRKGTGSSRETAAQCERYCGIHLVFAGSFAPIHQRNNINLGQIMGGYDLLRRLERGEAIPLDEFLADYDEISRQIIKGGGLFSYLKTFTQNTSPKKTPHNFSLTMAQKIIAQKLIGNNVEDLVNHKMVIATVDGGYSHEFTTAQVHQFLRHEFGPDYPIKNGKNFAAFEDHLIYADYVKNYKPFMPLIEDLRHIQKEFINRHGLKDYSAKDGISPGICHEVARQDFILPGDFIQATDSHTSMGGSLNSFAFGVGATEYAALLATGLAIVSVPKTLRFDLRGELSSNCTAKDVMLYILLHYAKKGITLGKVMEFGGEGIKTLSLDERATLCNMATECGAKTGICEPDEAMVLWLRANRPGLTEEELDKRCMRPDSDCEYESRFVIDLSAIEPMVAHPGNPDAGIPSDPTNGELIKNLGEVPINIAYGGSCTAGKFADMDMYAAVVQTSRAQGKSIPKNVQFFIQYGSQKVATYAKKMGYDQDFREAGITVIPPGCGACIGCGPGISTSPDQITISAINRNYQGRSGPGKLYLASPLTVAASAFAGKIVAFIPKS